MFLKPRVGKGWSNGSMHPNPPHPPHPRKTYQQRYDETSAMSTSDIESLIAKREARGEECGVLYRVLYERQSD